MENATKALMIAAAVIVAILIISLVMNIFNIGAEQAENANLDEYAIQQHNEKFKKYENTNVSGSEVNALLTTVFTHNNAQPDANTCVAVTGASTISALNNLTTSPTKVSTAARYSVVLEYSGVTKLVNKITITLIK